MRKTTVENDERLIVEAKRVLGTSSIKDTIHGALREVVQKEARQEEIRALTTRDCLDLAPTKASWRKRGGADRWRWKPREWRAFLPTALMAPPAWSPHREEPS